MNEYDGHRSLLLLVGELLFKNQLLREAIASKNETIDFIVYHLASQPASTCSCHIGGQLDTIRDSVKSRF
jgi:hypothetical protein